jgi:hypothetical protein
VIPQPGSDAWPEFHSWMKSKGNEKLVGAVDRLMKEIDFGPAEPH